MEAETEALGADAQRVWGVPRISVPSLAQIKPRLRGVSHQYAFFISVVCGAVLILAAPGKAVVAAIVYAISVSGLLGTSALYHRINWRPRARLRMKRLDHSMIFVLITGTYTPLALLALKTPLATTVLVVMWFGTLAGAAFKLVTAGTPPWLRQRISGKHLSATIYVCFALIAATTFAGIPAAIGWLAASGLIVGGAFYAFGALVYARERPNPLPNVFGYHEIFHALVILAASIHYAVIASVVL